MDQDEPFSNPIAPTGGGGQVSQQSHAEVDRQNLSNADFRKLLMTPRSVGGGAGGAAPASARSLGSVRGARKPILTETQFKTPAAPAGAGGEGTPKKVRKKFTASKTTDEDDKL